MQWRWFELRTPHFNFTSCALVPDVYNLAQRLERFHDAYAQLAGSQAVASPPITVLAFPSHATLTPFLPLYDGKPANLSGFFQRGSDENLIVVSFVRNNPAAMNVIYHEYTHLLFRRNENLWPLWLQEGMAEAYSTFEVSQREVQIARPIPSHLRTLSEGSLIPVQTLMSVDHDSPMYNEREQQGMFYAEAWILTHYLMNGDNPLLKPRFHQFNPLLLQGQTPEEAFTNSLGVTYAAIDRLLAHYIHQGVFPAVQCQVSANLDTNRWSTARFLTPVETAFRLGKELMRVKRGEDADLYFKKALKIAPASPLPYEGLGLLAADRTNHTESVDWLKQSFDHHSTSFLAHTIYAQQKLDLAMDSEGRLGAMPGDVVRDIRQHLILSIESMPDYATAHQLLGLLALSQDHDYSEASSQFIRVLELQPENQSTQLFLAQSNFRSGNKAAALNALEFLSQHAHSTSLKKEAEELLKDYKQR